MKLYSWLFSPKIRTSVRKKNEGSSIFQAEEVTNSARRLLDGDTLIQQCKDICSEYIKLYSHYASFSYVIQFFMQGIDTYHICLKEKFRSTSKPSKPLLNIRNVFMAILKAALEASLLQHCYYERRGKD